MKDSYSYTSRKLVRMLYLKSVTCSLWRLVIGVCLLSILQEARAAEPIKVAMTAEHWQAKENAEFVQMEGFPQGLLRLNSGSAVLKEIRFGNGTIEFDVSPVGRGGPGIVFRQRDEDSYELFYLRPGPNCPASQDCIQYAPQTRGVLLWDLFPQYQVSAPLRENTWNHIKLVLSGRRMNIFVNGATSPTLVIGRLEGDVLEGGLQLRGPASFANLVVTPDAVEGLSAEPVGDPTDKDGGLVRNWYLSAFSTLPNGKDPVFDEMPGASQTWKAMSAERNGLVNLSREYGLPTGRSVRALAWLKTSIDSDENQNKHVSIGWAREIWIFVNGKLVFADKNLYQPPAARKTPDGRLSLENGSFDLPLQKGRNQIVVALANNFFGWGLELRFADLNGVKISEDKGK